MPRRVPDIGKIDALVGHRPGRDLEEILRDVIAYHRATMACADPSQASPQD
jgi:hypothetical protein